MTAPVAVRVRLATPQDALALPIIDRSAGTLFREVPTLAWLADGEVMPAERHLEWIAQGTVWVAVPDAPDEPDAPEGREASAGNDGRAGREVSRMHDTAGAPVAFLDAEVFGDELHVWEISVHRDWQSRGIGRALLTKAAEYCEGRALAAMTLTTFRDVPWNAPFYATLGFAPVPEADLNARLRQVLAHEAQIGLPAAQRCAMRRAMAAID